MIPFSAPQFLAHMLQKRRDFPGKKSYILLAQNVLPTNGGSMSPLMLPAWSFLERNFQLHVIKHFLCCHAPFNSAVFI